MSKILLTPIRIRRLAVSLLCFAAYIGLVVLVFNMGKGYYVYLDNNNSEDGKVKALEGVSVSIDGKRPVKYYPRDRDKFRLKGKKHTLSIEVLSDGTKYEKKVNIGGIDDSVMISIPMLVAGAEPAITIFKPPVYGATPVETFTPGATEGSIIPEAQPAIAP